MTQQLEILTDPIILVNGKICKSPMDLSTVKNRKIIEKYVILLEFKGTRSYIHTSNHTCSNDVIDFVCKCIFLSKKNLKSIEIPCISCRILVGEVYLLNCLDKIDKFINNELGYIIYVDGKEFNSKDHLKLLETKDKIYNIILKRPHINNMHMSVYDMVIPYSCLFIDGRIVCEIQIQCATVSLLRAIAKQHNNAV